MVTLSMIVRRVMAEKRSSGPRCSSGVTAVVRTAFVLAALALAVPARAADNQIRPYFGATFSGGTTFVDLEKAAGKLNPVVGVSVVRLGDMFGFEGDLGDAPGFFQAGDQHLVLSSRVTT